MGLVSFANQKQEDVEHKDEDGVDGRGVCGWDGWVCGLGAVGALPIFGLVRRAGAFAAVLPTFVLVSRMQLAQQYRGWPLPQRSVFFAT